MGGDTERHYVYTPGEFLVLDNNFNLLEEQEIKTKLGKRIIDAYYVNGEKRIVEANPIKNNVIIHCFDKANNDKTKLLDKAAYWPENGAPDLKHGYFRCKENNTALCYTKNDLVVYNENLEVLNSYSTGNFVLQAKLFPNGKIVSLEKFQSSYFISSRINNTTKTVEFELPNNLHRIDLRLDAYPGSNKAYVSSILKKVEKRDYITVGIEVVEIDYENNTSQVFNINLDESFNSQIRIQTLNNKGVISDGENAYINLEEMYSIETTTTSTNSATGKTTTTTSSSDVTGKILVVKLDEELNHAIIKKACRTGINPGELSFQVELRAKKLFYIFNSQNSGIEVERQEVLDSDLKPYSQYGFCTFNDYRTSLHPLVRYQLNDGRMLYFHQYKRNLGVAISNFNTIEEN